MKTKVTYYQVKQALCNGFISPLNNAAMTAAASLVKALQSFRNAANPRAAAGFIDNLMAEQGVISIAKKSPKLKTKQNFFIAYVINEIRHHNNLAGATTISNLV